MAQEIPLLEYDPSHRPLVTPEDFLKHYKETRGVDFPEIDGLIISFSREFFQVLKHKKPHLDHPYNQGNFIFFQHAGMKVGAIYQGIGGPAAGTTFEEMTALGAKWCIMVGSAGSLQKHINVGDVCIIDKAIRDEGTSYHYLPPSKYVKAYGRICDLLEEVLKEEGIPYYRGTAWTTDAPYRETVEKVKKYQEEGVLCVEMEAASLFAIAQVKKIEIGLLVNISDDLSSLEWFPHFHDYYHKLSNEKRVDVVLRVIEKIREATL